MQYLVKITNTTASKAGAEYKEVTLEGEDNKLYGCLAFKGKYADYDKITEGAMIDCKLNPTKDGDKYFVNDEKTLQPPASIAQRRAGMVEAVREKQAGIKESQERKKDAIRIAGTMRDSTLIALAELAGSPLIAQDFQERWLYWQKWLEEQGDRLDEPTHKPPFQ